MATVESVKADLSPAKADASPRLIMRDAIEKMSPEIAKALPNTMTPERFVRLVLTECSKTPQLYQCTVESLLGASMVASQLGLEPGGALGHCYLIPRRNNRKKCLEAQFLLGYKGMIDLARRSGDIASIETHAVYDADEFDFEQGTAGYIRFKRSLAAERGSPVAYFAIVKFLSGGSQFDIMSLPDIERHRDQYADVSSEYSPWRTAFDAMAKKTLIRQMSPYLPLTPMAARAVAYDGGVVTEMRPEAELDEVEAEFDPPMAAVEAAPEEPEPDPEPEAEPEGEGQQTIDVDEAPDPDPEPKAKSKPVANEPDEMPEPPDYQKLESNTVPELREIAKGLGVGTSGGKGVLIERIKKTEPFRLPAEWWAPYMEA